LYVPHVEARSYQRCSRAAPKVMFAARRSSVGRMGILLSD